MGPEPTRAEAENVRRRSQRLLLKIPVVVLVPSPKKESLREETNTLAVNAHGALLILGAKVELGTRLIVQNPRSREEQPCKVVYLGPTVGGKTQVGVEFEQPAPHFWNISFPPEDWSRQDAAGRPLKRL